MDREVVEDDDIPSPEGRGQFAFDPDIERCAVHRAMNDPGRGGVHFHFTPTSASWLNQVEIWFSILQGKSLSGASFTSVAQLKDHIDAFIPTYNENAVPFVWTKAKVRQRRFKGRRISQL